MISPEDLESRLDIIKVGDQLRVRARETTDIEFKLRLDQSVLRKSLKTIAAFANQNGGFLVFGVQDKPRNLIGVQGDLMDEGHQSTELSVLVPTPQTSFQEFEVRGKRIAVLEVEALAKKPCIPAKTLSGGQGEGPILKQGTVYWRRRGQTAEINSSEFVQLMQQRDESVRAEIFGFLSRGKDIGFERAIVADVGSSGAENQEVTYFLPASAAKELNVIDRARLVTDAGSPAYQIQGNIELTVPSDDDPRGPMLAADSANAIAQDVRDATLEGLPFTHSHLRKVSEHLGFWNDEEGDKRNTGQEKLNELPVYYALGRQAVVDFARNNPDDFMDVCASQANKARWQAQKDAEAED